MSSRAYLGYVLFFPPNKSNERVPGCSLCCSVGLCLLCLFALPQTTISVSPSSFHSHAHTLKPSPLLQPRAAWGGLSPVWQVQNRSTEEQSHLFKARWGV